MGITMIKEICSQLEFIGIEVDMTVKLPYLTCKRCGHKWVPRIPNPPLCPNCHSPYWNRPKDNNSGGRIEMPVKEGDIYKWGNLG
jgi:predicted Zn-ribbon and HTH transcriptional regulator